ncbi:hypothetical protein EDC38_1269 [Marinimicrobium koreense]|uniref:Tetratricopeptide repeat protein n=1 Tax=Marinimicrobium koreense TaxID=306545 RepID=A0A3N1P7D0_9GAMM|nr:hypothetical protein [Marinimicrobium koreense]ROQ20656.1 hypothetical protein EDC38_1269 [Marinimicrobium koreense]
MSLMNDMLRDLDRRGGTSPNPAGPSTHRTQPMQSRYFVGAGLAVLVALVIAALVFWSLVGAGGEGSAPMTEQPVPAIDSAPVAESTVAEPEPRMPATREVEAALSQPVTQKPVEAIPDESQDSDFSEDIQVLLDKARQARDRDRLTRPAGDNAYEYYQQVLALSADHPVALAGLAAIAQRYRELAEAAMDREALDAAQQFLRRARSVDPQLSGMQNSEARLETLRNRSQSEGTEPETEKAADASSLNVQLDLASEDRRRAQQARQWWSRDQRSRARHFLEQTLAQWPEDRVPPTVSTVALVEFYLQEGNDSQAEQLLNESRALSDDEHSRLGAELWSLRGDNARALALLENSAEHAEGNEPYRALWARLNYEQGRHEQAANHYRQLLSDFGAQPAYWLGLGLAEDARQQAAAALQAFEQALASGAYDGRESIRRYLEGRVGVLVRRTENREP